MDELLLSLQEKYPSLVVLKKYPDSGQKWVYLVQLDDFGIVMLKIIKQMNERIIREIDIVNDNNIHGVPKIKEHSTFWSNENEYHYIFEEYVSGDTLTNVLKARTFLLPEVLKLLEGLLSTVVELESLGIVHRDIKPDNIIIDPEGNCHLIDFGIARNLNLPSLTLTAMAVGPHSPGYGAPELFQYSKPNINSKADLFSVGVVVYESTFGKHPFITGREIDIHEIWYQTATVTAKNYVIPGDTNGQLMGLIQTLMQKQVTKRPPSAKKALEWFYIIKETISSLE